MGNVFWNLLGYNDYLHKSKILLFGGIVKKLIKRLMRFRLDQILGKQGSKAKDVYASKISLASRVVKVERQVRDYVSLKNIFCSSYAMR